MSPFEIPLVQIGSTEDYSTDKHTLNITAWLFSHLGVFERSEQTDSTEFKYNQVHFTMN